MGLLLFDEDKIKRVQLIYLHHYYKADGPWFRQMLKHNQGKVSAKPPSLPSEKPGSVSRDILPSDPLCTVLT